MLGNMSSNAVLAKAHGMHGKCLVKSNFNDLLACKSMSEIAYYLKNRTFYANSLTSVNEIDVSRQELEASLKQALFNDLASLGKYGAAVGERFADFLISRTEIEQIMHSLISLNTKRTSSYEIIVPEFLKKRSHVDFEALGSLKRFDDLLKALDKTPYKAIIEPFRVDDDELLDYTKIENAMYTYLYDLVFTMINKHYKGKQAKELREIFNSYLDLDNYVRIVRLKVFYKAPPEVIKDALLPFSTIRKPFIEEMMKANTVDEIKAVMMKTTPGKRYLRNSEVFEDDIPLKTQYGICRHNIHFSTYSPVVMLSYIFVKQMEINDIINIIEGVRYSLPQSRVASLLTIYNFG